MKPTCIVALSLAFTVACKKKQEERAAPQPGTGTAAPATSTEIDKAMLGAFAPTPQVVESTANPLTEDKIALGRALFYETRMSASNKISCNTCHDLAVDGADRRKTSIGHENQEGKRNAPTVFNAAGHLAQFWDGRAQTIEDQAKGPITNPIEMAMQSDTQVVAELKKVPWYREQFKKTFPESAGDPITIDNIAKAIGAFERKLLTPGRWDRFLGGDTAALTADEKLGFKKFVEAGCVTCHAGPYVGGAMFQKLGLVVPWPSQSDLGRYEVTKQAADKQVFKVPSLRNIARTGPYFHDGSVASLPEAVKLMAKHQLGKELADADVASIVKFLEALNGELPDKSYIAKPDVPPK